MKQPKYDREKIGDEICDRLSEGEPLRQICRDKYMPNWREVYRWIADDPVFAEKIELARKVGFDAIAEEALEISDTLAPSDTEIFEEGTEGVEGRKKKIVRKDSVEGRKLRIWTRLQLLSKWHPTKYGDKVSLEHSGPGGKPLDDSERVKQIAAILDRAKARAGKTDETKERMNEDE